MISVDIIIFAGALFVAAFSPGPGLAALVATVLANGARHSLWFAIGIISGDLAWLALSLSGLALIAQQFSFVFDIIKWGGVSYLFYLAIKIWLSTPEITKVKMQSRKQNGMAQLFSGFSVTLGNPKTMLFYLAILPSIITPETISISLVATLCIVIIVVLAIVFACYAFAAEKARNMMESPSSIKIFNRITATVLAIAAMWIALA